MRVVHVFGSLATLALSTAVIVACSSPAPVPNDVGGSDQDQKAGTSSSGGSKSSTSSSSGSTSSSSGSTSSSSGSTSSSSGSTSSSGGPDPSACSKQAGEACFDCCFQGVDTSAMDQAYSECMCGATGACKTECGNNACAGKAPSAACDTCSQSAKAKKCDDAAVAACDANAGCKAASTCAESCPQN